jgi:biopolymer transport protein ExbB
MLDNKRMNPLLAALAAVVLTTAAPAAFAQDPAAPAAPAAEAPAAPAADVAAAPAADKAPTTLEDTMGEAEDLTPITMFQDATIVVKVVMIGLLLGSAFSWVLLLLKLFEFANLNKVSNRFVESFRSAKSIADINKIASQEDFEGNPLADMAAAASQEVELSRQAGLEVSGKHRETTLSRAQNAVMAVQASLSKRLASGMQFLASLGSSGPFIGLFGTVYGIMNSFIGIVKTQTTNLASVAPGIAEALLATGIGLAAAIPAVIFYNFFTTKIAAYGARTEGFVAELMNAISRQLDKGA